MTPPFGYRKDRNTDEIVVNPEAAETVKLIYSLYLQGCGQKEIARRLNALGRKTRATHKTQDGRYLWTYASVKNVLTEEAYTGVLINHRSETSGGKAKRLEQSEWIRHEHFFQVIVEQSIWAQVQQRLKEQARPANGNQAKHRYAGLLRCRECGNPFVPMIRYWNGKRRVEYVCKGYHRSGKSCCSSHRIHEETLDAEVQKHLMAVRDVHVRERQQILEQQKQWALRKPVLDAHCFALQKRVANLECELDALIIEHLKAGRPSN